MKSPLITMSAVTGRPTEQQIFEYLTGLKNNGIEQVMIYPRSGCELAYLEDEWFETVGVYLRLADEMDMDVWLYDDFNWPSGDAGGRVSANEAFRLRSVTVTGQDKGKISYASTNTGSLFDEKHFADLLSPKAVELFISTTHEQYYRRFAHYFGTRIRGIFTDEPAVGYSCTPESIPYYEGIEQEYADRCGRDFWQDLQAEHEEFTFCAMEVIGARFRRCYVGRVSDWCREHGIRMTGHLMGDVSPFTSTKQSGDYLKALLAMTLPGIDEISTDFTSPFLMPLMGGAEYAARDGRGAMAELFALGPCDMNYAKKKCMIYLCACFKIDHYFLAVSPLDMRGNALITDYFHPFTADQPDFGGMRLLAVEATNAATLAHKDYQADVYVRYPTAVVGRNIAKWKGIGPFFKLMAALTRHQIQWKYLDTDDATADAPVIELNDAQEFVLGDMVTANPEEVCARLNVAPLVLDGNGKLPNGLFVRTFTDGSTVVLNLSAPAGTYLVNGCAVVLYEQGVYTNGVLQVSGARQPIEGTVEVTYRNPNMCRAMFINEQMEATVRCEQDTEVRFVVRNDATAKLAGKDICCTGNSDLLCAGMRQLYGVSAPVVLKKGRHTLCSSGDLKYLPSVLLAGDFAVESVSGDICEMILKPRAVRTTVGERFGDFGEVEMRMSVCVPPCARALELTGTKRYTRVYLDGELIGEGICAPYIFAIDEKYRQRTVELTVVQASGLAPIFGDVVYFDQKSYAVKWRGTPAVEGTQFGVLTMNWIC